MTNNFTKRKRTSRRCGVFWRRHVRLILRWTISVWLFPISYNYKSDTRRSLSIFHDNRRSWVQALRSILEAQARILTKIYRWFTEGFAKGESADRGIESLSHRAIE